MDNWWAQHWYISSKQRRALEEERAKQDKKIRQQERLLDERIAARKEGRLSQDVPAFGISLKEADVHKR